MSIYGTCKTCGGETCYYVCAGYLLRENEKLRERVEALEAAGERLDSALEPLIWGRHCLTDGHVAAAEEASANWLQARGGVDKEQPQ